MSRLVFSPRSQQDIDDIWRFSAANWGRTQARKYIENLHRQCQRIQEGSAQERPVHFRAGYLKCRSGSHMIYFRREPGPTVFVVRILHQRMDAERHL